MSPLHTLLFEMEAYSSTSNYYQVPRGPTRNRNENVANKKTTNTSGLLCLSESPEKIASSTAAGKRTVPFNTGIIEFSLLRCRNNRWMPFQNLLMYLKRQGMYRKLEKKQRFKFILQQSCKCNQPRRWKWCKIQLVISPTWYGRRSTSTSAKACK